MKKYVALFVGSLLVFSSEPAPAGFLDTLKGLLPGHHPERSHSQTTRRSRKTRSNANKQEQPEASPSPNSGTSPGQGESPSPSPVATQTEESNGQNDQAAVADQTPQPASSPVVLQNSTNGSQGLAVDIDPPPLY